MDEIILETGHHPHLTIEAQGKLYIKGWDRAEVRASASGKDNLNCMQDGETVTVRSLSNCEMRVPYEATILIQTANGETILKSVPGAITVQHAGGGLTLSDVGPVLVEDVNRDLNAREIQGDLTIRHANRHVNVSHIAGDFSADAINAHLTLKKVDGNLSAHVFGNATLGLDPKPGKTCHVEAHGVLTCTLPPKSQAVLDISGHGPIVTRLDGQTETIHEGHFTTTLGYAQENPAHITLVGFGPITVLESDHSQASAEFNFDFDDMDLEMDTLSQHITRQVTEQLEMQMGMFEAQMDALIDTAGISQEKAERIRTRTQEKVARAQEKISKAQERAAEKIEMARRRAEREGTRDKSRTVRAEISFGMDAAREGVRTGLSAAREAISAVLGKPRAGAASDPVSDDERMMILNMLAEKKITIQEAETLLAALEGRQE
mgnify:CR=1 FL=1